MGNLQSDNKKKLRKRENVVLPAATSVDELDTLEDRKKDQKPRDQPVKVHDGHDDIRESIKISFEKMPGHAKRQAPQPPRILLTKVPSLFSYVQIEFHQLSPETRHWDTPLVT